MTDIVAYTLIDKQTGEQWKHSKRRTYDSIAGLRMGYDSCRWTDQFGFQPGVGFVEPPPFPGPFDILELNSGRVVTK